MNIDDTTKDIWTAERETFSPVFALNNATFELGDYAVVVVENAARKPFYRRAFPIVDGKFTWKMEYPDACKIPEGSYTWDFGVARGAVFDGDGELTDCDEYRHPVLTARYVVAKATA
jgi:hypothetical protein